MMKPKSFEIKVFTISQAAKNQAINPPKQSIDFSKEIYQKTIFIQKNQEEFI